MAIAAGGALGALMRWLLAAPLNSTGLPLGTLLVNLLGSFLIGALLVVFADKGGSEALRAGVVVGLLGGFTTFSAFSLETVQLLERGQV
ncbi:MAG: CrcB family protein, partial [Pseudomonadales bacterium]|nr:CrcB family protein [Pseudomonadales bacterium]